MHRASPASMIATWIAPTLMRWSIRVPTSPALLASLLLASAFRGAAATFPRYKPAHGRRDIVAGRTFEVTP